MKNLQIGTWVVFATLFLHGCSTAKSKAEQAELSRLGLKINLIHKTFDNGLNVLMVEDHTVPVVSYQTWVKAGSADETFGTTGVAHLFEHLMFKGSEKFGARAFFNELEAKGASVNAYTTRDYTVYHQTFIPNLLPRVIELESDRLASLKINQEALMTERQVVFEERRMRSENSPDGRMQEALWALAYKSHPYRWPVIGYAEDLGRLSVDDLNAFFTKFYQPGNVTLVITGDFDAKETWDLLDVAYGWMPGKKVVKTPLPLEPPQKEERRLKMRDQVASTQVAIAYPVTSAHEEDTYALDVLANILFQGTSSRAYQRIVEEKDLALGVSGVAYTPMYPGIFMINAVMKRPHTDKELERELEVLYREVQTQGVSDEEISTAVRQLTVQTVDSVRTAHGLGTLLGTVMMIFNDPYRYQSDLSKYQRVKKEDVKRVAAKYLIPTRKNVVTLVPGSRAGE